jgi:hypothetical protein
MKMYTVYFIRTRILDNIRKHSYIISNESKLSLKRKIFSYVKNIEFVELLCEESTKEEAYQTIKEFHNNSLYWKRPNKHMIEYI